MGATYRFLATVDEASAIPDWFRSLPERATEHRRVDGSLFYFPDFGPIDSDVKKSPIVNVFLPKQKRGVLITIGEVHFVTSPLSMFPGMSRINGSFRNWLAKYTCVFSRRPGFASEWDYYLEGSIRNWDSDVFALPSGMSALQRGAYFVADDDNDSVLDRVCRALELRGIEGIQPRS